MNFSYLYLDEKSLCYSNVLEKVMLSGIDGAEVNPSDYQNFNGYEDTAKSSYYDVDLFILNFRKLFNMSKFLQIITIH